eukprot:gnl/MRDRNA2_/MRDRNA2_27642_c0_seq2.p1 gnl/MRDRNA2_/MRDRNA2_27642_c0~~gnl/MRDRNA2_/MRDRNA2_27642_c0_seq2.p1  ORF type:complete len:642 (-),score=104.81 gnl/MRDRNA2_/MRDRNA2_27642_c0_seq2:133-2058(-)
MGLLEEHSDSEQQLMETPVPRGLQCPLTSNVMHDPVLLHGDGRYYERAAITEWLNQGRLTSPVTGQALQSLELTPCMALQAAAKAFLRHNEENKENPKPQIQTSDDTTSAPKNYQMIMSVCSADGIEMSKSPESAVLRRELGQLARLLSEAELAPLEKLRALATEAHGRLAVLLAAAGRRGSELVGSSLIRQRSISPSKSSESVRSPSPIRSPSFGHHSATPEMARSPSPNRSKEFEVPNVQGALDIINPNFQHHRSQSLGKSHVHSQGPTQLDSPQQQLLFSETELAETTKDSVQQVVQELSDLHRKLTMGTPLTARTIAVPGQDAQIEPTKQLHKQSAHEQLNHKVTLRNAAGAIAMAGQDGRICVVDSLTGTIRAEACLCSQALPTMAWSPSGNFIAAGGQDGVVRIIQARTVEVTAQAIAHTGAVSCLAWGPSDERIATGGTDGHVRIVAAATGRIEIECPLDAAVRAIAWVKTGEQLSLALQDGCICSIDAMNGELHQHSLSGPLIPTTAAWNPSGTRLAIGGLSKLQIIEAATGAVEHEVPHGRSILSVTWSPSGAKIATGCWDGRLRIVDVGTGRVEAEAEHGTMVSAVAWSPAGTLIATGAWDGKIRIVDVASGQIAAEAVHSSVALSASWRF